MQAITWRNLCRTCVNRTDNPETCVAEPCKRGIRWSTGKLDRDVAGVGCPWKAGGLHEGSRADGLRRQLWICGLGGLLRGMLAEGGWVGRGGGGWMAVAAVWGVCIGFNSATRRHVRDAELQGWN